MISFENFDKMINIIRKYDDIIDKSYDTLGIDIIESKQTKLFNELTDLMYGENFTDDGADLINWWLYDNVDKKIYDSKTNDVIADLKSTTDLYNYMIKEFEVYCKH